MGKNSVPLLMAFFLSGCLFGPEFDYGPSSITTLSCSAGTCTESSKTEYEYDDDGQLIESITIDIDEGIEEKLNKDEYTYVEGLLKKTETTSYQTGEETLQVDYTYNSDNNLERFDVEYLTYEYDSEDDSKFFYWIDFKGLFDYDSEGRFSESTVSLLNSDNTYEISQEYTADNNIETIEQRNTGDSVTVAEKEFLYDADNRLEEIFYLVGHETNSKDIFEYDADGRLEQEMRYYKDTDTNQFEKSSKKDYEYFDPFSQDEEVLEEITTYFYDSFDNKWVKVSIANFEWTEEGSSDYWEKWWHNPDGAYRKTFWRWYGGNPSPYADGWLPF